MGNRLRKSGLEVGETDAEEKYLILFEKWNHTMINCYVSENLAHALHWPYLGVN